MNVSFIHRKLRIGFKFLILFVLINFTSCKQEKLSSLEYSRIQEGFITPQEDNKVWCYYYWIGDDISKEGVSKELEAMKDFGIGAQILHDLKISKIQLMTNTQQTKRVGMIGYGLEIIDYVTY